MKLSVIIVNYNVKFFLTQCLLSVKKAKAEFEKEKKRELIEIFVVDNNSKDNSCEYVKKHFPDINLIENKKNIGFSAANNQAIKLAKGEYILLLNPDTVIPEDTFIKIIEFADKTPDAGGIGVKMIDGNGVFLPESKRSFPSPSVSFYKMFGLSKLFPHSKRFGKYHLTYLDKNRINEVDVLSGAFMFVRKKTIDKIGLLDETFFMYGEDIDFSYRITKAGYKNYYFPKITIIHYKGESTKKDSINYVYVFYNAMIIFAKKHFKSNNAFLLSFLIKIAVILRAGISGLKRIFNAVFLPLSDILTFWAGFYFITPLWETYRFNNPEHFPPEFMTYAVPSYILIWIFFIIVNKGYDTPADSKKLFKGILSGTAAILIIYSLLNEQYRYSRMLLMVGTVWALFFSWLIREAFTFLKIKRFSFKKNQKQKILFVSNKDNFHILYDIVKQYVNNTSYTDFIEFNNTNTFFNTIKKNKITKIVFSVKSLKYSEIINLTENKKLNNITKGIAYPEKKIIIESNKIYTKENIFETSKFNLDKKINKTAKRLFDIITGILFILFSPVLILLTDNKLIFIKNILKIIEGKYTFVGYIENKHNNTNNLPEIKKGILSPALYPVFDKKDADMINLRYAKNYHVTDDIYIVYKSFDKISNKKL